MPEGMEAAGEAMGATIPCLPIQGAVGSGDVQPSLVTTKPWPPLPSLVLPSLTPAAVSLRGFSPPHTASASPGSRSPRCQLFNLSLRLMNQTQPLQTRHFNECRYKVEAINPE